MSDLHRIKEISKQEYEAGIVITGLKPTGSIDTKPTEKKGASLFTCPSCHGTLVKRKDTGENIKHCSICSKGWFIVNTSGG